MLTDRAVARDRGHLGYQAGLDGLRGVAVLVVLFYHQGTPAFRGGFLGVDIFFVLSGFLITALLIEEWNGTRRIDLRSFWARRARRLLPALALLLVIVAAYAEFAASSSDLHSIRLDGLATLFYVENWRLVFAHQSYFQQFSTPSPLRHAWSLAIEEQWYLIWPVVLGVLLRLTRGRVVRVLFVVLVLAFASAFLMMILYHPGADPSRVYYGTDTRAQSLLLGAALALVMTWRGLADSNGARAWIEAVGVAGGLYLLWLITHVGDTAAFLYRGGLLLTAGATVCVIAAAIQPESRLVRPVLSFEPLRRIGLISYGLYLFHWPIFLWLDASRTGLSGAWLLVVRLAASFATAIVSYLYIEKPVRRRQFAGPRLRVLAPVIAGVAVVTFVAATTGGATTQPVSVPSSVGGAVASRPGAIRVLIAGDSQAQTLGRAPYSVVTGLGVQFTYRAILGCGIAVGNIVVNHQVLPTNNCGRWPDFYADGVRDLDPQVSLLEVGVWELADRVAGGRRLDVGTSAYEHYLDQQLDQARKILTKNGAQLVLLTMPCAQLDSEDLMSKFVDAPARIQWLNGVWARYVARHRSTVTLIDINKLLCPDGRYQEKLDGVVVRPDGLHYSVAGAEIAWKWLVPQLRPIAERSGK